MGETTWRGATIAWAHLSDMPAFTDDDLLEMGRSQLDRRRGLTGARAAGFLAGRSLIRESVLRLGGGPVVPIDSSCPRCGGDHAAPRTPGFTLSVSHADDLVVVAAAYGTIALGVDVESDSAAARVTELRPMFAAGRVPDLAGWTRIEAAVKADGRGIEIDPGVVRLHPAPQEPGHSQEWTAVLPGRASRLQVATLSGPIGYTLSVAIA